jgi:Ni,Fe-hydrogenase III large subunit
MKPGADFAALRNGQVVSRAKIPRPSFEDFRRAIVEGVGRGYRVAALFGHAPEPGGAVELYALLADSGAGQLRVAATALEAANFPSLTPDCPQVHLFEREIAEQFGIRPEGHPWLKPVRFPHTVRSGYEDSLAGVTEFYRVEGEEVHEVAVGPVHAGVIEPGHFRFQCHGEEVFHLEIALGYQHRGVEAALRGGPNKRTIHYMETLAGDTSVGHATAYCQVVEALAECRVPLRAQALRGVALELERLANHTGDLGALAQDVGFLPSAAYCGRLRGDFLNTTALICGSRFGRGLVRPGGVAFGVDGERAGQMRQRLEGALKDVAGATGLLWETSSVMARFEDTGSLSRETAVQIGLVGVAARACGIDQDARLDFPSGISRFVQIPVSTAQTGDVFARAYVRWLEIQRSGEFLQQQLRNLPEGPDRVPVGNLQPDAFAVALVEGWRGPICHAALTDGRGRFAAYKIVDASFHNWFGLALALRGQQISDFPLCNKSFNLSYCGHDL